MTFSQCGLLANKKSTISLASKKQFPPKHQIKFVGEMSSERIVFLDTEVPKGPRFAISKTLDVQTHFKPTETFHICISPHVTLSALRRVLSKGKHCAC